MTGTSWVAMGISGRVLVAILGLRPRIAPTRGGLGLGGEYRRNM